MDLGGRKLPRMSSTDSDQTIDFLTLPTAARRAGVGLRQLRRARDRGELPCYRIGGWDRVRWLDVLAWLHRCRLDPDARSEARR